MKHNSACIFLVGAILVSCGNDDAKKSDAAAATAAAAVDFVLKGSLTSAFAVNIDGAEYSDLEDFYTQESARLPDKVKKAGYDGYTVKFDAQIGFKDLGSGMYVYVQPNEKRGYSGQGVVAQDLTFALTMPGDAAGDIYKVRANKRINLVLTKDGSDSKKFCYNFSAQDFDVPYGAKDKPIVLSTFKTTLTAYECVADKTSGSLQIPTNSDKPQAASKSEPAVNEGGKGVLESGVSDRLVYAIECATCSPTFSDDPKAICGITAATTDAFQIFQFTYASGACEKPLAERDQPVKGYDCIVVTHGSKTDVDNYVHGIVVHQEGVRSAYLHAGSTWLTRTDFCKTLE